MLCRSGAGSDRRCSYYQELHYDIIGKSEDQIRRWRNPRIKAVRNFVSVIGNKPIAAITRDDMLDFRQHWLERIEAGEVTPILDTANDTDQNARRRADH